MKANIVIILFLLAAVLSLTIIPGCATSETATTQPSVTTPTVTETETPSTTTAPTTTAISTTTTIKPEATTRTMSTEEKFLADGLDNYENLNSYKYELALDMSFIFTGQQEGSMVMKTISSGGLDKTAEEMEMKMLMSMTMEGLGLSETITDTDNVTDNITTMSEEVNYDIYILKDWAYMRLISVDMEEEWQKYSITDPDEAFSIDVLEQQTMMLDSPSKIEITGSEMVNGFDCFVLSVTPDMEALSAYLNEQNANIGDTLDYSDVLKKYEVLCYVGKSSNILMRMSIEIIMEITDEETINLSDSSNNATVSIIMDMTMYDLNKPFSVILPPEAENAENAGIFNSSNN